MSDNGNGKTRAWVIVGAITGAVGLVVAWSSGFVASTARDAAFQARTEEHLRESAGWGPDLSDLKTSVEVNRTEMVALKARVGELVDSQQRLTDKMDLLIQSEMRRGNVTR